MHGKVRSAGHGALPDPPRFWRRAGGNAADMAPVLILAIVLIVLGLVGLAVFPWGGIVLAVVGVALVIAYLVGFGKRAAQAGH
jgi:hypothetical protein